MIKKVWLLLISIFVIFWFWVSFANPIAPSDYRRIPNVCYKVKNVEIDNYRVVIEYGERKSSWGSLYDQILSSYNKNREVYEPKAKECTKCSHSRWGGHSESKVYLLNKSIDIADITQKNIDTLAIYVWDIYDSDCTSHYDKINIYKITNNWGNYEIVSSNIKNLEKIRKFPLLRFFATIIETLVLFFIAKTFRKKDELVQEILYEKEEISNKKLLLRWVIPTTITLPLLWFVFPLIIWDWNLYIVVWEILVATIEAIMLKYWLNISRKRAIITSIIWNLFSFLIILLFNLYQNLSLRSIRAINGYTIFFLWFVFIEWIILFSESKSLKESVSNKKLVLCWLFTPIVDLLLIYFIIRLFDDLLYKNSELLVYIFIITSKLVVDVFIIKWWRKISRKKSILISALFNSYLVAIFLAFVYFFAK